MGLIFMLHLDHHFEAIRHFSNAIKVDPLDTRSYVCRAQAYHKVAFLNLLMYVFILGISIPPYQSIVTPGSSQY